MAKFNKIDWTGGINQFVDATKVDPATQYYALFNGRTRRNRVDPINTPLEITSGLPIDGVIQGIYAIDHYLIVFIAGKAYYRDYESSALSETWHWITSFQMSATAPRVYLEAIPASYINFTRKAASATDATQGLLLGGVGVGSPRCAIVMDGESQPWVIFPDATAREIRTYAQWTPDNREYVPAGCILPLWFGGVLYCVGKDSQGVYNELYRSVTGRPLDYVIAVTPTGDKTSSDESVGGAEAMSYRVDYGAVTALSRVQSTQQAFLLTTARNSYLVVPDYTRLTFAEAALTNQPLFQVGALNDQCIVDVLADTAVIHYSGIRSFNAILNLKFEGRNAPFSRKIEGLLNGIVQTAAAAINYDNYAAFSVNTIYGPVVLWYDTLLEEYASIDQFTGVGTVKQFTVLLTQTDRRLFFYTTDNRMFEYFAGSEVASARVFIKDFIPQELDAEHSIANLRAHFTSPLTDGYVQASVITDGRLVDVKAQQVNAASLLVGSRSMIPYAISSNGEADNIPVQFGFKEAVCQGYRTGAMLEWNAQMALTGAEIELNESTAPMPEQAKAAIITRVDPTTILFVGSDGDTAAGRVALNKAIKRSNPDYVIGCGDHAGAAGSTAQIAESFTPYWSQYRTVGKFFAAPGDHDLETDAGEPFYSALRQSPTRYFKIETDWADLFIMNSGYNVANAQIEPDNLNEPTIEESRQFAWLRSELAIATGKHKLVIWHHSPHVSVNANAELLSVPLASWGATAHIGGHARLYERSYADDLYWFNSGAGTTSAFDTTEGASDESQALLTQTAGYLRFRVWPLVIECAFVDVNGVEFDNFVLRK